MTAKTIDRATKAAATLQTLLKAKAALDHTCRTDCEREFRVGLVEMIETDVGERLAMVLADGLMLDGEELAARFVKELV